MVECNLVYASFHLLLFLPYCKSISLKGVYHLLTGITCHKSAKYVDLRLGRRVVKYAVNIPMPFLLSVQWDVQVCTCEMFVSRF